jgi:hypothetical protein
MNHYQGGGHVVLAQSSYLQSFVVGHGTNLEDRCVWVVLMGRDRLIGIYTFYAPNLNLEHGHLWDYMDSSLLATNRFVGGILTR